ncbi:MAG: class I SAM-dependent methyltransferase, partial [Pirellulaceae bacterium]
MESAQFQVHADLETTHWWFTARREIFRRLIDALIPPSKDRLLVEVGCGTGGNIAKFASAYSCVGIDISPHAIERAVKLYPDHTFVCGEAPGDIEQELASASIVLLLDVLEHVDDDYQLLAQILSTVRPGCYVFLSVPADPCLWSQHDVS